MKVCYQCADAIQAMVREEICLSVSDWHEACSEPAWNRVKATFARRWKTKKDYVSISAVRQVPLDYKPIKWNR